MTKSTTAGLTAVQTFDPFGRPALGIALSGTDGQGRFALVDPAGLEALQRAGARALYLVGDGRGLEYVTYLRPPSRHSRARAQTAARAVCGDPKAHRIEYRNGDRLDLRSANLHVRDYAGVGAGQRPPRSQAQ